MPSFPRFSRSTLYQRGAFVNEQRLAVDFNRLGIPPDLASRLLEDLAERDIATVINVNLISEMRRYKEKGCFVPDAQMADASESAFNCTTFVRHGYALLGIRLPSTMPELFKRGIPVAPNEIVPGDLVFTQSEFGEQVAFSTEGDEQIAHVGMVTSVESNNILHCAGRWYVTGVFETSLAKALENCVGIRRYVPNLKDVVTLSLPRGSELEEDTDLCGYIAWDEWAKAFKGLKDPGHSRHTLHPIPGVYETIK